MHINIFVLTCLQFTITEKLLKMGQEELFGFFQSVLGKDFGYEDDIVIESLHIALEELRRAKMDTPGSPPSDELPQKPFGLFVPPSVEQMIGRRTLQSEHELLSAKRRSLKDMRPVIPADGGPVVLPLDLDIDGNSGGESEHTSYYDTGTVSVGGSSSQVSASELQTVYLDGSDVASTVTTLSRPYSSHLALNDTEDGQFTSGDVVYPDPGDPEEIARYHNVVAMYEADLERTLEAMELNTVDALVTHTENVTVVEVNGHQEGSIGYASTEVTISPDRTPLQSPNQTPVHTPKLETPPFSPLSPTGSPYSPSDYPFPVTPISPSNGPFTLPINGLEQAEPYYNGYPESYPEEEQYSTPRASSNKIKATSPHASPGSDNRYYEASVYL